MKAVDSFHPSTSTCGIGATARTSSAWLWKNWPNATGFKRCLQAALTSPTLNNVRLFPTRWGRCHASNSPRVWQASTSGLLGCQRQGRTLGNLRVERCQRGGHHLRRQSHRAQAYANVSYLCSTMRLCRRARSATDLLQGLRAAQPRQGPSFPHRWQEATAGLYLRLAGCTPALSGTRRGEVARAAARQRRQRCRLCLELRLSGRMARQRDEGLVRFRLQRADEVHQMAGEHTRHRHNGYQGRSAPRTHTPRHPHGMALAGRHGRSARQPWPTVQGPARLLPSEPVEESDGHPRQPCCQGEVLDHAREQAGTEGLHAEPHLAQLLLGTERLLHAEG